MSADPRSIGDAAEVVSSLRAALREVVHGKDRVIDQVLTATLAGGHVLLQDVPGVGKTTLASGLASALSGSFSRVQFTADLLPGDLTGMPVLNPKDGTFSFRKGPLFANVVLADEINRTTPKTQSALFEAMEEGQVTVDGTTHRLPRPFLVIATQNPFDDYGTFQLPESQLDRFLMRLSIGYPDREAERAVLRQAGRRPQAPTVASPEALEQVIARCASVRVTTSLEDYVLDLVAGTRRDSRLLRGVSPRGGQALYRAIRAHAVVHGRDYAIPEDVRDLVIPVLSHRVLARRGGAEAAEVVLREILDGLDSPA